MRISSAPVVLLMLAGCGNGGEARDRSLAGAGAPADAAGKDDGHILCAVADAPLARTCTVERETSPRGLLLTLRHRDGGFRRLLVTGDGRGVIAADGAEPTRVSVAGADEIEVAIGADRYRLPATVKR